MRSVAGTVEYGSELLVLDRGIGQGPRDAAGADCVEHGVVHGEVSRPSERTRYSATAWHRASSRLAYPAGSPAWTAVSETPRRISRKRGRSLALAVGSAISASRPAAVSRRIGAYSAASSTCVRAAVTR